MPLRREISEGCAAKHLSMPSVEHFRLPELHRRRHGKCIGVPNTVSTMMQLSDSLCGELQIAKQKDGIAHCRAASPDTPFVFCCGAHVWKVASRQLPTLYFQPQNCSVAVKTSPDPTAVTFSFLLSCDSDTLTMQRTFHFAGRRNGKVMRFFSTTTARPAINKIFPSAQEAIKDMKSDSTLLVGGFGFSGVPNTLINQLRDRSDIQNLRVVSNNAGMPGVGLGQLLETKQIGTMVASYIGDNKVFEQMYLKGELSLELTPQGTIAEKCAAGAAGVPAFYTPAAYGTIGMFDILIPTALHPLTPTSTNR